MARPRGPAPRGRPRPRRARPRPARRTSRGCPSGPGRPEEAKPSTAAPCARALCATATSAARRSSGARTTPPLPTRPRPTSNCGLTIASASKRSAQQASTAGQDLGQRDEGDVGHHEVGRVGQVARRQRARVGALEHGDALVGAQRPVQLAVGDVERDDVRGAALQQAVGEAAGRGADVQAAAPGGVDARRVERVGELDPAARDEARALVDGHLDVLGDDLARLGRALAAAAAQAHLAGHDRRRGAGARGEEPALGEQGVEAELGHRRAANGTAGP